MIRTYRDEAVVLRTAKLGEADRIITLLTRNHGQVRAVAKGVRRTTSKFGSRLEPFTVIDVQLHHGRTFDVVTQVEAIASHGTALAQDVTIYAWATVMLETAERLSDEAGDATNSQYLLLVGALHALSHHRHSPVNIVSSYLLRALSIAGWAPSCYDCAVCGAEGPHQAFSIPEGGVVCVNCRSAGYSRPVPETVELMGNLLSGDWVPADRAEPLAQRHASDLIVAYTQWHLERRLRSVPVVERTRDVYR